MQLIQKRIARFVWLILLMAVSIMPTVAAAAQTGGTATEIPKPSHYVAATYFHNTFRCPTCHKIEELSAAAIRNNFANELKSGALLWRVINVDEPANQHYNTDYQLYTKSLIIAEIKDGKEVRWKNLEKVWTYVRDDAQFEHYVQSEIKDWIKD
jgi:hypothetical protein